MGLYGYGGEEKLVPTEGDGQAGKPSQISVIVAPTVSQAKTLFVKSKSGDQNDGQGIPIYRGATLIWFRNVKKPGGEGAVTLKKSGLHLLSWKTAGQKKRDPLER